MDVTVKLDRSNGHMWDLDPLSRFEAGVGLVDDKAVPGTDPSESFICFEILVPEKRDRIIEAFHRGGPPDPHVYRSLSLSLFLDGHEAEMLGHALLVAARRLSSIRKG